MSGSVLILIAIGWMLTSCSQNTSDSATSQAVTQGGYYYVSKSAPPIEVIIKNISLEGSYHLQGLFKVSESEYTAYLQGHVLPGEAGLAGPPMRCTLRRLENNNWILSDVHFGEYVCMRQ